MNATDQLQDHTDDRRERCFYSRQFYQMGIRIFIINNPPPKSTARSVGVSWHSC